MVAPLSWAPGRHYPYRTTSRQRSLTCLPLWKEIRNEHTADRVA
jgi:hypothetical protein